MQRLKCLGGIMHLKPTSGCQISTLIFGFGETLYISHEKLPKDSKVLVKGLGNTFNQNPKWQRTVPSFGNFSWNMQRVPPTPNIKVDI
jgi:hypothetical protein